jgi:DNA replication protein DnaC
MPNLQDHINDETREALQQIAGAQHKVTEEAKAKRDRTKMMADVIRQQRKGGGFRGDAKIRWTLQDADVLLMRGLAYAIGPTAQWLPEYDQVAEWLSNNQGKGLMCIGDCGRGKTIITRDILPLIFKNYISIHYADGWVGHPPYNYFLAKELKSRWAEVERCKIICVDDVGTEPIAKVYGETHNYFSELVDLCNDRDKLLICSTNLTHAQLFGGEEDGIVYPARCDQRTFSRLVGNTVRVYFEGEDLRIK